jgi:DNA (cytosine-5)-methyltransferase 1
MGYHLAGFDVVGWDLHPQPQYPFMELWQGDALAVLADEDYVRDFDAVHASPPCQLYSALHTRGGCPPERCRHLDLVPPVRRRLQELGLPWVIENVVGAPLRDPITLCGSMFGLGFGDAVLRRHRLFETSFAATAPADACRGRSVVGVYGTGGAWTRTAPGGGGVKVSGADAAHALGITWTNHQPVLAQAIPPAYTEHLGQQLLTQVYADRATDPPGASTPAVA